MTEIQDRYLKYNAHAGSYTWKYDGRNLNMAKTLSENGILDEDDEFYQLSMNDDTYLQAIHLYFNDDLTEAQFSLKENISQYRGMLLILRYEVPCVDELVLKTNGENFCYCCRTPKI